MHKGQILLLLAFFILGPLPLSAQEKFTLSGQITDAANGEDLPFVNVVVKELPGVGTISNVYGFYSLTLAAGTYTIEYRSIGYENISKQIQLDSALTMDIEMAVPEQGEVLKKVTVTAQKKDENLTRTDGSVTKINIKDVKKLPTFGGEPDIMKVAQLSPGVKTAGDGNSGFYVRGGGLGQNLVLLDEAPVYNPSHVLGFYSVFNSDVLKGAELYKGGMPAEYGGRTASVMDVRMKDGNLKEWSGAGGVGLIASRLALEGPIKKDKGSILLSGRTSYVGTYLKLSDNETINRNKLYFYYLNFKANFKLGKKDKIYLSGYTGRDVLRFDDLFGLDWGNTTATFRWNHVMSKKLFSNTSVIYNDYTYNILVNFLEDNLKITSSIRDFNLKQQFSLYANNNNTLKFGFDVAHHSLSPGVVSSENEDGNVVETDKNYGLESAVYLSNEQKIGKKIRLNYGVRFSMLNRLGEGNEYMYDEAGNLTGTTFYESGEIMNTNYGIEPRLSSSFLLSKNTSLKLNYNRNFQYLHLLTSSTTSTPIDVWVMSSNNIKPQIADQVSLGYYQNLKDNKYEFSTEVYYKGMQNVIDYKTGANVFLNDFVEAELVYGTGQSYGVELLFKKKVGKFTGWIGYTLSRTEHKFDAIDNGNPFPARQDRTHDLSIVAIYKITDRLSLSGNFVYYTGDAVTFPSGQYTLDGITVPYYTERNGYRMPDYHRLDLGLTWDFKKRKKFESSLNVSLYNVYGRQNAYTISFRENEADPGSYEAVQISLFRWVPSVTYNFNF
ncbi:MAG: TonB-dependent receptor [Flavobacteriales bacterium]|nr:TonB-dependent receptor [Flavobacteriales bacterium]